MASSSSSKNFSVHAFSRTSRGEGIGYSALTAPAMAKTGRYVPTRQTPEAAS